MIIDSLVAKLIVVKYILENGYENSSTPSKVRRLVKRYDREPMNLGSYNQYLSQIDDWIENRCGSTTWGNKAKQVWTQDHATIADGNSNYDDLPMICSIINIALVQQPQRDAENERKQQERERQESERERNLNDANNRWAGEVGQKVSFVVAEIKFIRSVSGGSSYYAPTGYLHYIKGTDNLWYSLLTYDDSADIVVGDELTGTIKALNTDNKTGNKITRITRYKIVGHRDLNANRLHFGS